MYSGNVEHTESHLVEDVYNIKAQKENSSVEPVRPGVESKAFALLKQYWRTFIETGEICEFVRPEIAESWKRSIKYGVNPTEKNKNYAFLPDPEVKKLLNENQALLDVAYPLMSRTVDYIEGTQCALTLHDKNCRLICHMFAGDDQGFYRSSAGFNIGAAWDEKTIGTCAPSLCIRLDQDVQLIGAEHFKENLGGLACTASPIHAKNGEVIGCINMFGDYKKLSSHTRALVKQMALLIQSELNLKESSQMVQKVFNLMTEGIIVLDEQCHAVTANNRAAAILQLPQKSVVSLDFRQVFRAEHLENRLMHETVPFTYAEYPLHIGEGEVVCGVTVTPMLEEGKREGALITLRRPQRSEQSSMKKPGNHASYTFDNILSQDSGIMALKDMLRRVSSTGHCILLEGESGTGKELFAHALHTESDWNEGPFVTVNCGSLPRSLIESELFGYEKGSFTGARSEGSPGKFELADGGTIFLDEIGELPLEIQATLLRVLDNHRVRRIGAKAERSLNFRVVAATNRNLYEEVKRGKFRSDLYFRLSVLKYDIPPLRARGNDVCILANHFLEEMNRNSAQDFKEFSAEFYSILTQYSWPGNIRELRNVVTRGFYASSGPVIMKKDLPQYVLEQMGMSKAPITPAQRTEAVPERAPVSVKEFEKQQILDALRQCGGNVVAAGKLLGFSKATIYRRIKAYQIQLTRKSGGAEGENGDNF